MELCLLQLQTHFSTTGLAILEESELGMAEETFLLFNLAAFVDSVVGRSQVGVGVHGLKIWVLQPIEVENVVGVRYTAVLLVPGSVPVIGS